MKPLGLGPTSSTLRSMRPQHNPFEPVSAHPKTTNELPPCILQSTHPAGISGGGDTKAIPPRRPLQNAMPQLPGRALITIKARSSLLTNQRRTITG